MGASVRLFHLPGGGPLARAIPDDLAAIQRTKSTSRTVDATHARGRPCWGRGECALLVQRVWRCCADTLPDAHSSKIRSHDRGLRGVDAALDVRPLAVSREDLDVVYPNTRPPVTWPARAFRCIASYVR